MSAWAAILLTLISLAFMRLDRFIWGTSYTPGVVLSFSYSIVTLIYTLSKDYYPFVEIAWTTFAGLALCLCACMICSVVSALATGWRNNEFEEVELRRSSAPLILLISALAIYLPLAVNASLASGGFWLSDTRMLLSRGLVGHLHVLLAFAMVWFFVEGQGGPRFRASVLVSALGALSLYPVKGWTVIPLVAIMLGRQLGAKDKRLGWAFFPLLGVSGMVVFFVIYAAAFGVGANSGFEALIAIFDHLIFYLTAGLFGLDAVFNGLQLSGGFEKLFAPLYNLLTLVTGEDQVSPISEIYVVGILTVPTGSNVFSYFGSLIGYGGIIGGLITSLLFVIFGYLLLGFSWRSKISSFRAFALYILATFAFGGFEFYLWHLTPYEIAALALIAALPTWLRKMRTS